MSQTRIVQPRIARHTAQPITTITKSLVGSCRPRMPDWGVAEGPDWRLYCRVHSKTNLTNSESNSSSSNPNSSAT
jgi:hypothetical protein